jgi:PiT family inorganic phosphate transporter
VQNSFVLVVVVLTALAFDFTNGFHDTANALAPTIATGALRPKTAVAVSGILNLAGAFLSLKVAATIASSIVVPDLVTLPVIFGGLAGAIVWNVTTWFFKIPSSSSHALIGGVIGAMLAHAGFHAVLWRGIVSSVAVPGVSAPLVALVVAALATMLVRRATKNVEPKSSSLGMRVGQIGSSSLLSLAHGTNDAQKTMGVVTLALIANHSISPTSSTPTWVIVVCAAAISIGTFFGGWRIIRTMGHGVTTLAPNQGFAAQVASSAVILSSSHFGLPLSTTYVATGSIVGAGVAAPPHRVRWHLLGRVATAWIVTLPIAALCGAAAFAAQSVMGIDGGVVVVGLVVALYCAVIFVISRRSAVTAGNVNEPWEPLAKVEESVAMTSAA